MGGKRLDLAGKRFGKLVVRGRDASGIYGNSGWSCICDCGVTKTLRGANLVNGSTQSCGCLLRMRPPKICAVAGCGRKPRCSGLCGPHYAKAIAATANPPPLTHARLLEVLDYDPSTGVFRRKAGSRCDLHGDLRAPGDEKEYLHVTVDGVRYLGHRLAWFYMHGVWPVAEVDHINGRRNDNRLANLREASRGLNAQNLRGPTRKNTSGFLGVSFAKDKQLWVARITVGGKYKVAGYAKTPEGAYEHYLAAKRRFHEGNTL